MARSSPSARCWPSRPGEQANIPAPLSQWYGLPGLNATSGAQWIRAFAYSTPPHVVYAGLEGGGVVRSTTGGATWSAFNAGFPNPLTAGASEDAGVAPGSCRATVVASDRRGQRVQRRDRLVRRRARLTRSQPARARRDP